MTNGPEQISNFNAVFCHFVGYEGAGKCHTPTSMELVTGIPAATIRNHMSPRGSHPTWSMMKLYMKVLDTAFTDALLSPVGLSVRRAVEHESPSSGAMQTELAQTMVMLAQALEDGVVDDGERRRLSPHFRATGQDLIALANRYDDEVGA